MDAGVATHTVFAVVTPVLVIVALGVHAPLVAGQKRNAGLGLIGIDPVVRVPVPHQPGVVTVPEFVQVCHIRLNASGTDDHVRLVLQDIESLVPPGRFPRHLEVQDDAVTNRQVCDSALELIEHVNRDFGAVGQFTLEHVAGLLFGNLAGILPGKALRIRTVHARTVQLLEPFR